MIDIGRSCAIWVIEILFLKTFFDHGVAGCDLVEQGSDDWKI